MRGGGTQALGLKGPKGPKGAKSVAAIKTVVRGQFWLWQVKATTGCRIGDKFSVGNGADTSGTSGGSQPGGYGVA